MAHGRRPCAPGGTRRRWSLEDGLLLTAQTCASELKLPRYSGKARLRARLLFSIRNAPTLDADLVMHTAEGWGAAGGR